MTNVGNWYEYIMIK